ncbi:MAG: type II toxin-antitoxin system Phd/YefM family antitoxin [Candidatus Sericytochromatia bacterium]
MQVNLHEAKTHFSRLIDRVQAGEEVIIAKGGKPVARLVPLETLPPRRLGTAEGQITLADDFNAPLPDELLKTFYS